MGFHCTDGSAINKLENELPNLHLKSSCKKDFFTSEMMIRALIIATTLSLIN